MRLHKYLANEGVIQGALFYNTALRKDPGKLDLNSRDIYQWQGSRIINTKHGKERIAERNMLKPAELIKLFQEALEKVKAGVVHVGETILFWSRSLKQAFVSKIDDHKNIRLITFLPRNKHLNSDPDTHEVVLEGVTYNYRVVEID